MPLGTMAADISFQPSLLNFTASQGPDSGLGGSTGPKPLFTLAGMGMVEMIENSFDAHGFILLSSGAALLLRHQQSIRFITQSHQIVDSFRITVDCRIGELA